MSDADDNARLIADAASRIFEDLGDPTSINKEPEANWRPRLWQALEDAGLTLAWVSEANDGAGGTLSDGFAVVREAGRQAAALPLVETMLAGWLLDRGGVRVPAGMMTVAPMRRGDNVRLLPDGTLDGTATGIAFAPLAAHLALLANDRDGRGHVALVEVGACKVRQRPSISGDPAADLSLDGVRPIAVGDLDIDRSQLELIGAAARSVQIAGALQGILDLAVTYAGERVAFGRTISKFQAVQHMLARLAGEVAAATAASGSAADTLADAASSDKIAMLEVGAAKIRCGEAATEGAMIAHQVHGAIGFTAEHILHRYTRRLWSWRDGFGSESEWAVALGKMVAAEGADRVWPMLASR